VKFNTSKKQKR